MASCMKPLKPLNVLIQAADQGGSVDFARIGMMQALNRHVERVFDSRVRRSIGGRENRIKIVDWRWVRYYRAARLRFTGTDKT
jgi:hypothetical protein